MARKKMEVSDTKIETEVEFVSSNPAANVKSIPTKLSVDYGREDINNLATKINEIIDYLQ